MQPPDATRRVRHLPLVGLMVCGMGATAMWYLYFTLYWPYRGRFNEAGRYMDGSTMVVYHEQAGLLVVPAVALSVLALVFAWFWRSSRSRT